MGKLTLLNRLVTDITEKTKTLEEKSSNIDQERENYLKIVQSEKTKYEEVVSLNSELLERSEKIKTENILLQNQIRKPLREKLIRNKIFIWRLKGFFLILIGPIIIFSVLGYIIHLNHGDLKLSKQFIENYSGNIIISALITLGGMIYTGVFIKIFSDKFNQSAINAFKSNIEIPDEMKHLN